MQLALRLTLAAACLFTLSACEKEADPLPFVDVNSTITIHTLFAHSAAGLQPAEVSYFAYSDVPAIADWSRLGVELALEDYGAIHGVAVNLGAVHDSGCTARRAAEKAASFATDAAGVFGVIGTTCSVAAYSALPILSNAGIVLISPTNTAPSLTSDLKGVAGADHHPNYFRTSINDLRQADVAAAFMINRLGARQVAVVSDGSAYAHAMAQAFTASYEALGGRAADITIRRGQTDYRTALQDLATTQAVFMPLFQEDGLRLLSAIDGAYVVPDLPDVSDPVEERLNDPDTPDYRQAYIAYLTAVRAYAGTVAHQPTLAPPPAPDFANPQPNSYYVRAVNDLLTYLEQFRDVFVLPAATDENAAFQRRYQASFRSYQDFLSETTTDVDDVGFTPTTRSRLMEENLPSYQLAYLTYAKAFRLYLERLPGGQPIDPPPAFEPRTGRSPSNGHYRDRITAYNDYLTANGELPLFDIPSEIRSAYNNLYNVMRERYRDAVAYTNEQIAAINQNINEANSRLEDGQVPTPLLPPADLLEPEPVNEDYLADPEQTMYALAYLAYSKVYLTYINAVNDITVYEGPSTESERAIRVEPIEGVIPRLGFAPLPDADEESPYAPAPAAPRYSWDTPKPIGIHQPFYQPLELIDRGCTPVRLNNCGYARRIYFAYARYMTWFDTELVYHVPNEIFPGFRLLHARINQHEYNTRQETPETVFPPATFDDAHITDAAYQQVYLHYLAAYDAYLNALPTIAKLQTPPSPADLSGSHTFRIDTYRHYIERYGGDTTIEPPIQITTVHENLRRQLDADIRNLRNNPGAITDPSAVAAIKALHRVGTASLLTAPFLANPLSRETFLIGPSLSFHNTRNQATGRRILDVEAALRQRLEEAFARTEGVPVLDAAQKEAIAADVRANQTWASAYDAATLLLEAIRLAATPVYGGIEVDKQTIPDLLRETRDFQGLSGVLACDAFGDCADQSIVVYHNIHPVPIDSSLIEDPRDYLQEAFVANARSEEPLPEEGGGEDD